VSAEEHTNAALQVLQELVEKFSLEENGEVFLRPFGQCNALLDLLVNCGLGLPCSTTAATTAATTATTSDGDGGDGGDAGNTCDDTAATTTTTLAETMPRRVYIRCLCYLLKRSSCESIAVYVQTAAGPPAVVMVKNNLFLLREQILRYLQSRIPSFCAILLKLSGEDREDDSTTDEGVQIDTTTTTTTTTGVTTGVPSTPPAVTMSPHSTTTVGSGSGSPVPHPPTPTTTPSTSRTTTHTTTVAYPGHTVRRSFSAYRVLLIEFTVLMIEADCEAAPMVPTGLWNTLIELLFMYPHNNIYHSMFFRLLFAVLRQNNEVVLKNILQKSRLVAQLYDHFEPYSEGHAAGPGRGAGSDVVKKYMLRGLTTNCANAIRLQMETLPPTSYLHIYLMSHTKWTNLIPTMRRNAMIQQSTGLGFRVPTGPAGAGGAGEKGSSIHQLAALFASKDNPEEGVDHGSAYATSLGFEGETAYPIDATEVSAKKKTKKKKKKKKKRKSLSTGGSTGDADAGEEAEEDDDEDGDSDEEEEGVGEAGLGVEGIALDLCADETT
jgi:hypothetical protein